MSGATQRPGGGEGTGEDPGRIVGVRGAIGDLRRDVIDGVLERRPAGARADGATSDIEDIVEEQIEDVRERGDDALFDAAERYDGVRPAAIEVPRRDWDAALATLEPAQRAALRQAADAIAAFHAAQRPRALEWSPRPGLTLGRRPDPLARVGVYAPGGRAAYPSSVLMGAVPARVAGVGKVVVCSPCGPGGRPSPAVLAACAVAGVDRVFAAGGATAIAAMAYGSDSVPRVDRIVGPGNAWVDESKRQVARVVGIDNPAGPSELLILADASADPRRLALELIAQAEHDPDAACVLVTVDAPALCDAVSTALERELERAPRGDIAAAALAARGALLEANDLAGALDFAERHAPEHLLLALAYGESVLPRLRNAGTVFLGDRASVAFGDYATGANHVLPTGGMARVFSGLSLDDFVRWTTWQRIDAPAAESLASTTRTLAELEGLPGHAAAAAVAAGADDQRPAEAEAEGEAEAERPADAGREGRAQGRRGRSSVGPRQAYLGFPLYSPRRGGVELELSANTNRWGVSPSVREELERLAGSREPLVEYPTPYADALRDALAAARGVDATNVVTGCGSDDVIDSAVRAFCEPGDVLVHPAPTFPMAGTFARMNAVRGVSIPLEGDDLDVDRVVAAGPRVVYLCRPNNPTGGMLPRETVTAVLERTDALVLIDEAYGEYAGESLLDLVLASGRALVTGTFSKAWGLAGARVGYALGAPALVDAVQASRGPYKVGALAERLALAALRDGTWVAARVAEAVDARERLADELRGRGYGVRPSSANFLFFDVAASPTELAAGLRERGIGVRAFEELGALRVTVGPWQEMARFLGALDAVAAPGGEASGSSPAAADDLAAPRSASAGAP